MPPHPRNRPALEEARPEDTRRPGDHGWRSGNREPWLMLFGDGEWHEVTVRAWWTDDQGRGIVQLSWHAELSTWTEAYIDIPEKRRPG